MPGVSQYPQPPQYPQYPQAPYPPPGYGQAPIDFPYYQPAGDLLAPARRAAAMQFGVGVLLILCCVGIGAVPWFANAEELLANSGVEMPPMPPGWTLSQMFRLA